MGDIASSRSAPQNATLSDVSWGHENGQAPTEDWDTSMDDRLEKTAASSQANSQENCYSVLGASKNVENQNPHQGAEVLVTSQHRSALAGVELQAQGN